jgi:hypothetical protein
MDAKGTSRIIATLLLGAAFGIWLHHGWEKRVHG